MDKEVIWLHGEVKTPPFSVQAAEEVDFYLFQLQQGVLLSLPHSRPMPSIGPRCHEMRIRDRDNYWRIVYRIDANAVLIEEVFPKKTQSTPPNIIKNCKQRFLRYNNA